MKIQFTISLKRKMIQTRNIGIYNEIQNQFNHILVRIHQQLVQLTEFCVHPWPLAVS